jgi:hypothetical protein
MRKRIAVTKLRALDCVIPTMTKATRARAESALGGCLGKFKDAGDAQNVEGWPGLRLEM